MNTVITLAVSMAACLLSQVSKKVFTDRTNGSMTSLHAFNAISCVVSFLVLLVWGGIEGLSPLTAFLGTLFGMIVSLQAITLMVALRIGPMSYTLVISNFSTVISALSGFFLFGEEIGVFQIVGIALMLVSFALAVEKNASEKKASLKWLLFSALTFLFTGGIGVMQKLHQNSSVKDELNAFLVFAFAVSFLFSGILMLINRKREKQPCFEKNQKGGVNWLFIIMMLAGGFFVAANHKLNLYLSGIIPSAIFFPIVNGGGLMLSTVTAVLFFRERPTVKQWIGVAFGILSVLFLCLPS